MAEEQGNEQEQSQELRQFVIFDVAGEEYALPIEEVQEVVKVPDITPLPNSEAYIEGLMNLRGQVIPVVDVIKRFQLSSETVQDHVIVLDVKPASYGILTSSVQEVLRVRSDQIQEAPSAIRGSIGADFIQGVLVLEEEQDQSEGENKDPSDEVQHVRTILILSLGSLLTPSDQQAVTM